MTWKGNTLDLYKVVVDEELKLISMHQDRIKFFTGLLSGLVAGTVAGLFKSEYWYHYALMGLGPVLIIVACHIAEQSIFRLYQRFLEAVTVRAKLEQLLGMAESPMELDQVSDPYWAEEPIVAPRHLESRKRYKTSGEWLQAHFDKGSHRWTIRLFRGGQALGAVLLVLVSLLAWSKYQ